MGKESNIRKSNNMPPLNCGKKGPETENLLLRETDIDWESKYYSLVRMKSLSDNQKCELLFYSGGYLQSLGRVKGQLGLKPKIVKETLDKLGIPNYKYSRIYPNTLEIICVYMKKGDKEGLTGCISTLNKVENRSDAQNNALNLCNALSKSFSSLRNKEYYANNYKELLEIENLDSKQKCALLRSAGWYIRLYSNKPLPGEPTKEDIIKNVLTKLGMQEYIQDTDGTTFEVINKCMGRGDLTGLDNCIKELNLKGKEKRDEKQELALKLAKALRKSINLLNAEKKEKQKNKIISGIIQALLQKKQNSTEK